MLPEEQHRAGGLPLPREKHLCGRRADDMFVGRPRMFFRRAPVATFPRLHRVAEDLAQLAFVVRRVRRRERVRAEHLIRTGRVSGIVVELAFNHHVGGGERSEEARGVHLAVPRELVLGKHPVVHAHGFDLALEETSANPAQVIVSRFKLDRAQPEINIQVLELGIKPQDFSPTGLQRENNLRLFGEHGQQSRSSLDLGQSYVRSTYLRWYPLIAACSFIRANKSAPFASEYIIPQLLMQWIRTQCKRNHLVGLRYFSCASARASDMGFDYVFPVSNGKCEGGYCSVLRDSFSLTEPVYLRDYKELWQCEEELLHLPLDKIKS